MKKIVQTILHLVLILLILAGIGAGGYYGYQWWQKEQMLKERPKVITTKDGTSISPAWHNWNNYQKTLRQNYSFINKVSNYVPPMTWDGKRCSYPWSYFY